MSEFIFRKIKIEEADIAADIEEICFPPHEACSRKHMKERIDVASDFFLVAIDKANGRMAGFLNGVATDEDRFSDDFFTDASTHNPEGKNVMLLGLDVIPEYRMQGLAKKLVSNYADFARDMGKKRLVLTCLDEKVPMYLKFGFRDLGESASVWGGEKWHEMDYML